jgi:hypothetical protein
LAVVNIVDVSSRDLSAERLWGCNIELPVPESQTQGYAVIVAGWVLGRSSSAVAVELVNEGAVLLRVPIDILRLDIVAAFPEVTGAERSGFQITLNLSEMAPAFDLLVQTVFEDGSRVRSGVIRGRRRALYSDSQPRLQPLMLTTLDRTGSTWMMRLLGEHPQMVAYRPFQYEPRVGSHWIQI